MLRERLRFLLLIVEKPPHILNNFRDLLFIHVNFFHL